jgi:hypothetical protein
MTAATMIRTYHEYASVGKRFESGQLPHRRAALNAKNHILILPKSTATNPPPANHKPVTPAKAGVHILRTFEIMDSRLRGSDGSECVANLQNHPTPFRLSLSKPSLSFSSSKMKGTLRQAQGERVG